MGVSSVDLLHWFLFEIFNILWVLFVAKCLCERGLLLVGVARENLSKGVLHLHFTVKGSRHKSLGAEGSILAHPLCDWRLLIMLSIIGESGLPVALQSEESGWTGSVSQILLTMHSVAIFFLALEGIIERRVLVQVARENHLRCSNLRNVTVAAELEVALRDQAVGVLA